MNSIYLIVSGNDFLIKNAVDKIVNDSLDAEVIKYDLKEDLLINAIEDLDTYNFFSNRKIVILENPLFLTASKNPIEQDVESFLKYIENPSRENTLIVTSNIKLDERKNIVKVLKKCASIVNCDLDINQIIDERLDNYKLENDARVALINYTLSNYERIINELEKLKLYKYDDKIITKEDVDACVIKSVDDNIFNLIDAIIKKDKALAFEIYNEIADRTGEVNKILILLANKFRLIYQVKILSRTYYSDNDIGKIIGSHPYPVKLARNLINKFTEDELISYLRKLSDIDIDLKSGNTYQNIAFEIFMMSL